MKIPAYLYDANGKDEKVELTEEICVSLSDKNMLWIDLVDRTHETILEVASILKLKNVPLTQLLTTSERPKLDKYDSFYRFFIISVDTTDGENFKPIPIDFIVGKNFVVSIHESEVPYFKEFHELNEDETRLGELDTESFIATLLDFHIVSYFRAIEQVEHLVEKFDEKILRTNLSDEDFLKDMIKLRRTASKLRRWFAPQRDLFYALSRPDFRPVAESDSAETFQTLNLHFESAIEAIENSRDTVLSVFDLYTTRASHRMNNLMKRLTFVTIIVGSLSVIAGILGMNFEVDFFKSSGGFWEAVLGMGILAAALTAMAKVMDWI